MSVCRDELVTLLEELGDRIEFDPLLDTMVVKSTFGSMSACRDESVTLRKAMDDKFEFDTLLKAMVVNSK